MILPIIYIGLFMLTVVLFFIKKEWAIPYKKGLAYIHIISLLLLLVDVILITKFNTSFKTIWADRLVAICFLISGAITFALYGKSMKGFGKIYFGVFFFYPAIAALAFLIDRILFVLVASPLIVALLSPDSYYSDKDYDIRTVQGIMAPKQLVLIKKDFFTETEIGKSGDEYLGNGDYKNFKIISQNNRSTIISVEFDGQETNLTFSK